MNILVQPPAMIQENKTIPPTYGKKNRLSSTNPILRTLWISSIILVVFLSLSPKIDIPFEFRESDKVAHFVAYLWLAVLPFFAFSPPAALRRALFMVPLGIGLEFAQIMVPGRSFSFGDILANIAGIALGIWMAGALKKRLKVRVLIDILLTTY